MRMPYAREAGHNIHITGPKFVIANKYDKSNHVQWDYK